MTHGPENLSIMDSVTTKYPIQKSVTISRRFAVFLGLVFIFCLIATGLFVYSFTSCPNEAPTNNFIDSGCEDTNQTFITTTTEKDTTTFQSITTPKTELDVKINYRLPRNVLPHSYKINLIPFLREGNFTFHGEVWILVNATEETTNITMHTDALEIKRVSVTDVENNTVSMRYSKEVNKTQFLVIMLDEELKPNNQYYVYIQFKGVLNDFLQGFYRSSYVENNQKRWLAATQFQATDARKAFPCFDEPAMKARFQINIARLKNMTSISNMRRSSVTESVENLPEYVWDHFEESVPMSTYLVAFVVSDFQKISSGNFSIWARASALSQAHFSLTLGPKILKFYENFFSIHYPLPKIDMVAIPDFSAGAMENWGLITYREGLLLYEKGVSGIASQQRLAHVVAHELAHQWFGNLVTPSWWTDLWLNEGFATYVEYRGAYSVVPEWRDLDMFIANELHSSLTLDALNSSHPISVKVINNPEEIDDIFDRISYSKGASVIRMMQHFLTMPVFRKALNKYLSSRLYSNAEQDDLWEALTDQSHLDGVLEENMNVKEIMDTWTLQTGFPIVTATRYPENDTISLKQERFLLNRDGIEDNTLWWISVSYTDGNGNYKRVWLKKEKQTTIPNVAMNQNTWYLINLNQTGYFRVNYDENNWKLLTERMDFNGHKQIDPKNRAQLIDDSFNLAFAGYISYDIPLNLSLYLKNERDYLPWRAALNNLEFLFKMFERSAHFDKYKAYLVSLLLDFYKEMEFITTSNEDPLMVMSKTELIHKVCRLGVRDCIGESVKQFYNWKSSSNPEINNFISPDLRETIYCTAIADGGQEEWDFAWKMYQNTNVASEKEILLSAMGCSKETWIISRYLEWSITENSGIRKHDSSRVFAAISENPVGRGLAYRFLKINWNRMKEYLGQNSVSLTSVIRSTTENVNTEEEIEDMKNFFEKIKKDLIGGRTAQQCVEQGEANVRWMKKYFSSILKWLENSINL